MCGGGDGHLCTMLGEVVTYETKLELLSTLLHWCLLVSKDAKGNMAAFYEDTLSVATVYLE